MLGSAVRKQNERVDPLRTLWVPPFELSVSQSPVAESVAQMVMRLMSQPSELLVCLVVTHWVKAIVNLAAAKLIVLEHQQQAPLFVPDPIRQLQFQLSDLVNPRLKISGKR
jgi:hypothetical protein